MPPANDRLDIASEEVKDEHVPDKVPGAPVQEDRGADLPGVRAAQAIVTQAEIIAREARLICFEKKLRDEGGDIRADQPEEDDTPPFGPTPRE